MRRSPSLHSLSSYDSIFDDASIMPLPSTEHGRYFIDARVVKIKLDDGTLYQVFRHFFEQHSPIFVEEYLSNEDADYIHLADVTRIDFDRFLSLMYPSALGKCDVKTPEEWISVLRLATKWSFVDLRVLAIGQLRFDATPIDRIAAARELDVPEWLLPAFIDVCMAPKWLTQEDAERLGLSTVVEIGRIREEMHKAFERSYYDRWTPMDVEKAIIAANLAPTPPRPDTFNLDGYQSSWVSRVTTPDALSPVRTPWMCSRDGLGSLVLTPEERVAHAAPKPTTSASRHSPTLPDGQTIQSGGATLPASSFLAEWAATVSRGRRPGATTTHCDNCTRTQQVCGWDAWVPTPGTESFDGLLGTPVEPGRTIGRTMQTTWGPMPVYRPVLQRDSSSEESMMDDASASGITNNASRDKADSCASRLAAVPVLGAAAAAISGIATAHAPDVAATAVSVERASSAGKPDRSDVHSAMFQSTTDTAKPTGTTRPSKATTNRMNVDVLQNQVFGSGPAFGDLSAFPTQPKIVSTSWAREPVSWMPASCGATSSERKSGGFWDALNAAKDEAQLAAAVDDAPAIAPAGAVPSSSSDWRDYPVVLSHANYTCWRRAEEEQRPTMTGDSP